MTEEYKNILSEAPEEIKVTEKSDGYYLFHRDVDQEFRIITDEGNLTKASAYIFEEEFGIDTDYGFAKRLEGRNMLEDEGFLENGKLIIDIPERWTDLCGTDESMYEDDREYGENFNERASEVARIIDSLGKSRTTSKEIAKHLDLTPMEVANTMMGIADEEDVKGELGEKKGGKTYWNVDILDYETNIVVDLD